MMSKNGHLIWIFVSDTSLWSNYLRLWVTPFELVDQPYKA
jgi:hypothetical protein